MDKPKHFFDNTPRDDNANLKAYAAWYNGEDHKTVLVVIVKTT